METWRGHTMWLECLGSFGSCLNGCSPEEIIIICLSYTYEPYTQACTLTHTIESKKQTHADNILVKVNKATRYTLK